MPEQPMEPMGAFEARLSRELRVMSEPALRSVDATRLAHDLATPASALPALPGFLLRRPLRSPWSARLGAGLAAVVIAAVALGGALLARPNGVAVMPSPSLSPSPSAS